MREAAARRRLATVLFLDIVGSTAIASVVGDARWRIILARFRHVVRRELKRNNGVEQDWAGDGLCATFVEPVQALRCAAAMTAAVQELGLDIRTGVHTGECEEIEGNIGGIGVHIAARIMALAGAAEVFVSSTVKELVAGAGATFEDRGTHELKGVEDGWRVYELRSIEFELPPPLDPEVAAARLSTVAAENHRRYCRAAVAAAVLALLVTLGALEAAWHLSGGTPTPPALMRLDPSTGQVLTTVHDRLFGCGPCGPNLWVVDGTLWERTGTNGSTIAIRSLSTGRLVRTLSVPAGPVGVAVGFSSLWVLEPGIVTSAVPSGTVERIDGLSGRVDARIPVQGDFRNLQIVVGDDAVWVLDYNGTLTRLDPASDRVSGRFNTGALDTYELASGAGDEWICDCAYYNHDLLRFDPRTGITKTFSLLQAPESWKISATGSQYIPRTLIVGFDRHHGLLWFLNAYEGTLIPWNLSGQVAPDIGLVGRPIQATMARRIIWVAATNVVDRVNSGNSQRKVIALGNGVRATGIAVDPLTNTVWVANSATPRA